MRQPFLVAAVAQDGLTDHWREMLRLLNGQVNESRGVGSVSKGLLLKYRATTAERDQNKTPQTLSSHGTPVEQPSPEVCSIPT
jgi:hypothetical protein